MGLNLFVLNVKRKLFISQMADNVWNIKILYFQNIMTFGLIIKDLVL